MTPFLCLLNINQTSKISIYFGKLGNCWIRIAGAISLHFKIAAKDCAIAFKLPGRLNRRE